MSSPLPEDPYISLGVPKDATSQTIKTKYRKLVLKFHPDKVQDEAAKQAATDQFHKIQKAYEVIGDEDRRARYDAQCKLAQLRKDAMERDRQGDESDARSEVRTPTRRTSTDTDRGASHTKASQRGAKASPRYEERRPGYTSASSYAAGDYFEPQHRPTSRKDAEYERAAKRQPPRSDRERSRGAAREAERVKHKEREARRDREIRRDRERKTAYIEEESESDSDEYETQDRRWAREDELKRARAPYHEQVRRDKEEATRGYYDTEERAHKVLAQADSAREYIGKAAKPKQRSSDEERRPSPVRMASSKDRTGYIKRAEGRPSVMVRRGSSKPKTASREADERRGSERRASVDDTRDARRPPPLTTSKSSPVDIKPPFDKQRAASVQVGASEQEEFVPPRFRRAETMPHVTTTRDSRRREPQKTSGLRQTETTDGLLSPGATPSTSPSKYTYRQEYADDTEYPTPDGYRTEVREPGATAQQNQRYTRSPSPMREADKTKGRTSSARYPASSPQRPAAPRTTSTSYVYNRSQPTQGVSEAYARPSIGRENSRRESPLYGEVPTTAGRERERERERERDSRSPRQTHSKYDTPPESARYQKDFNPEDIRVQSGYGSRRPSATTRPSYSSRQSSYNPVYVK
ncbi:hypothetical protein B0A50_01929 [Salinomyces thailandicus]|uniref:J domain-containing protein n=1 Tax=Salinomyces thailandicus TaxID=706561 RepID=A0A4U0U6X0_9PEZI|nr:hypothetical protein B0A50_01929 [Salinomyces thailandica]